MAVAAWASPAQGNRSIDSGYEVSLEGVPSNVVKEVAAAAAAAAEVLGVDGLLAAFTRVISLVGKTIDEGL